MSSTREMIHELLPAAASDIAHYFIYLIGGTTVIALLVCTAWLVSWRTILGEIPAIRDLLNLPAVDERPPAPDRHVSFDPGEPEDDGGVRVRRRYTDALDEFDRQVFGGGPSPSESDE